MASHVLVVDDQSNVRATIAYLLDKEGFRVTKAASGQEALKLLEDQEFEYALIDGTIVKAHRHACGAKGGLKIKPSADRAAG